MTTSAHRTSFLPHEVPTWAPFDALSGRDVHDMLALRADVFVVEQNCAYADPDGRDPIGRHLLVRDRDTGLLLATARVLPAHTRFPEISIGRVCVRESARKTSLGRALVAQAVDHILAEDGAVPIRLAAQAHLERFYGSVGFVRDSDLFDEDGIPHIEMLRRP